MTAIREHHGTKLIRYFYQKALTRHDPAQGPVQEIELVYEQLYPSPQLLELEFGSSTASCSDGSNVSAPIFCAMI